jgi:hypothetical protein
VTGAFRRTGPPQKWWRKAAEAGENGAQWFIGVCYYYGRGVDRDNAKAVVWFRKVAAKGNALAAQAVQSGIPGEVVRSLIVRFTSAGSAPARYEVAREFAGKVHKIYLIHTLQMCNRALQEPDSAVPHQSLRDTMWVDIMMIYGLSDEDLELAKHIYAYSKRTKISCAFCGSNSAPLRNCSLCMELRYCIGTDCQHVDWNKTPAAESHKVLCPRIFVCGSKGRTRRA